MSATNAICNNKTDRVTLHADISGSKQYNYCNINFLNRRRRKRTKYVFVTLINNDLDIVSGNPHCTQDAERLYRQTMSRPKEYSVFLFVCF